ncbi:MAG: hypothetical protein HYR97_00035 [Candidatus Melainabacteria bacterium]|nr:hypothetical protein [Candidatus Melainabacteria bacterium]
MTVDGGTIAVSGIPTPQPDLVLHKYMADFAGAVVGNENRSLEKASQAAKIKTNYAKKFAPQTKRINRRLSVVNKEIARIESQVYRTKDPQKLKALQDQRKPFAEESAQLQEHLKGITQSMQNFAATNPKLGRLKSDASTFNLQNHAILASLGRNDPETAGYLRSFIAESDKGAEDKDTAASSFIGVSYGAGGFGLSGMLPGM